MKNYVKPSKKQMEGEKEFRKRNWEVGRNIAKEQQKTSNCKWYLKQQGK